MADKFLYSAVPFLKYHIYTEYLNDRHYVWCGETFDLRGRLRPKSTLPAPPSSNPAEICEQVRKAIVGHDRHDHRIVGWRTSLLAHLARWESDGTIPTAGVQELTYMLEHGDLDLWRPLVYVIDRSAVAARMKLVPMALRAGLRPEYIVEDLEGMEFDVLELPLHA